MSRGYLTPVVVTPPATYPVSLAEVRARLRLETTDDDADLTALIGTATERVQGYAGLTLLTTTYQGFLDEWPCGYRAPRYIELPRGPVQSVTAVKTYDDSDVPTTWDDAEYYAATSGSARIMLRSGASWPTVARVGEGISIEWIAGYGADMNDVPADRRDSFRSAIIALVGGLAEQRGDEQSAGALKAAWVAVESLLHDYRMYSV